MFATCDDMFVSGIHSRHSFLDFQASNPFVAAAEKKTVSCREAEGLATELSHTRFVTDNTVIVSKIWIAGF